MCVSVHACVCECVRIKERGIIFTFFNTIFFVEDILRFDKNWTSRKDQFWLVRPNRNFANQLISVWGVDYFQL